MLAGVGVKAELTRMVTFLSSQHNVPIQICTLSAVSAPGGNGHIILRDTSGDADTDSAAESPGSTYEQRMQSVTAHFAKVNRTAELGAVLEIINANPNIYARPWKKALMLAPQQNHSRYLAYLSPRPGGVYASFGVDAIEEFFPSANLQSLEALRNEDLFTDRASLVDWATQLSVAIGTESPAIADGETAWNGIDWYVAFGEESDGRKWEDALKWGFVSAGGGEWYSRTLRNLPIGGRIFAYIPNIGYVGCGEITGSACSAAEATFINHAELVGTYEHHSGELEYFIPVKWLKTVSREQALKELGLFANQNSACKLRDPHTVARLHEFFGVAQG